MSDHDEHDQRSIEDLDEKPQSLPREFLEFLVSNRKFWLIPILVILLLLMVLIFIAGNPSMPFIYTLF